MEKQNNDKAIENKNRSPWILVGLLSCFILILIAGIIIYFVYRVFSENGKKEFANEVNSSLNNLANQENATLPADAFYKNRIYDFSLSYPLDWWHEQSENGDGVSMSPDVNGLGEFNDKLDQIVGAMAYGWNNTEGLSLDQFLMQNEAGNNQIFADYKIDKQGNVNLGGLDAIRLDESYIVNNQKMRRISIFHLDNRKGLALIATCPEAEWQKYQMVINNIIQSYRLDEKNYNQEKNVSGSDANQIMTLARDYVEANSISGMTFDLNLDKQTDEWARLTATPAGEQKADEAIVLLKKENGKWMVVDFGTDLSQWHDQTPGGFWND